MEPSRGVTKIPCECGFDDDDLEFCANGIVYSDLFRRLVETVCECDCHSSVAAVVPIKPKSIVLHSERELVAA